MIGDVLAKLTLGGEAKLGSGLTIRQMS
jgi:hypothetical protein